MQKRANREPMRRSRAVQALLSRRSLIRMLGAVFAEMDEDWASRHWFTEDSTAKACGMMLEWNDDRILGDYTNNRNTAL